MTLSRWYALSTLVILFSVSNMVLAQTAETVCAETARTLVDGARSMVDSGQASRGTAAEIRWSTAEGHKGVCRVDSEGRVFEVSVTEFPLLAGTQFRLTCSSERLRRRECALREPGIARLEKQLSKTQCVMNQTWGVRDRTLWVDQGCSGQFVITTQPKWEPYSLTCESHKDRRAECKLKGKAEVSLTRQISSTACRQNTNWGYQDDLLWVDRGCRAAFLVRPAYAGAAGSADVRTAALLACSSMALSHGFKVLNQRVVEVERNYVNVELSGERSRVTIDLFCRYDIAGRSAQLYGG